MKNFNFKNLISESLFEVSVLTEMYEGETIEEAEYKGKKVKLNKPRRGDVKKYKVYVKNDKGNVVKVNFGDKNMEIKRDNPKARKSFRARHNCADKKDKTTAGYWSCKFWSTKSVSNLLGESESETNNDIVSEKDDRCTRIAKRKYDTWPSAYASGAVVRCRKGEIWKDIKEEELDEKKTDYSKEKDKGLHGWFERQGGSGKSSGWVDCNTCKKDSKTGRKKCKSCGREKGEKRAKYPACRPTPSDCGTKGKGKKWGKKSKSNESIEESRETNTYMFWQNLETIKHAVEEMLSMDKETIDKLLADGHGWALDHIATSSDDIEETYHFIESKMKNKSDE